MDVVTELKAQDSTIRLRIKESGYCLVSLQSTAQEIDLGGDLREVVAKRFLDCLRDRASLEPSQPDAEPGWEWFLSLTEPIHSLYMGRSNDAYVIKFEDENANIVGTCRLTEDEAGLWQNELSKLAQDRDSQRA